MCCVMSEILQYHDYMGKNDNKKNSQVVYISAWNWHSVITWQAAAAAKATFQNLINSLLLRNLPISQISQ